MKNEKVKSNLDEMQEAKLLEIEHNGCWLAFWGLLAAMIVELFVFGPEEMGRAVIGEWIVFMVLAVYLGIACMKNGIWDRRLKANFKTNLVASLIAGLTAGLVLGAVSYYRFQRLLGSLAVLLITTAVCFVLCLVGLSLAARQTKKNLAKLENEGDEDE